MQFARWGHSARERPAGARRVRPAAELLLAGLAFLPNLSLIGSAQPAVAWIVIAMAAAAAARPDFAVLALAALLPIGRAIAGRFGGSDSLAEPLVLAFITGWLLRDAVARPSRPAASSRAFTAPVLLFAGAAAASCAVYQIVQQLTLDQLWPFFERATLFLARDYFPSAREYPSVAAAALFLEGGALAIATITLCRRDPELGPRMVRMISLGCVMVAALMFNALLTDALRSGRSIWDLAVGPGMIRRSWPLADVNAAGSYLVMGLFPIGALAFWRRRVRWGWAILAGVVAGALWLTGSRTAFLAAPAVAVLAAWARWLKGKGSRLIVLGVVLAALAGAMVAYVSYTGQRSLSDAADVRVELTRTGLRMFADHPVFGAGVGLYYSLSNRYASRELRSYFPRENAHNNFLQILAELGLVGLGLFAWVIWSVGRFAWPHFIAGRASAELAGAVAGLLAFLVTCLMGHPLLIREIAYAFWMMLGLAAALVPDTSAPAAPVASGAYRSASRLVIPALALILAASVPLRVWQEVSSPNFARTAEGLSDWQTDREGVPFRWMEEQAGFSIRATARTVTLPLKLDASSRVESCPVDILVGGTFLSRVTLAGHEWQKIRLVMPPPPPGIEYWRIELRVQPAQPADPAAAAPPRVQVGQPTLNRQAT